MIKKIILLISIVLVIYFWFYLYIFKDTNRYDSIEIPSWILQDLCNNPKIVTLSARNITFRNGPITSIWWDSLNSFFTLFKYFRTENYLSIINVKNGQEDYEIPRVDIQKFLLSLSKDGKWFFYHDTNDIPFLQSVGSKTRKKIIGSSPYLLDWSADGKIIIFYDLSQLTEPFSHIFVADISQCLDNTNNDCSLLTKISLSYSYDLEYAHIINDQSIIVKPRRKNAQIISIKNGQIINELKDLTCLSLKYNQKISQYVSDCGNNLELYNSDFSPIKNIPLRKESENADWSMDGQQIAFITNDDSDLERKSYGLFLNANIFNPSRLYLIDDLKNITIRPITRRTDEEIYWYSWLTNDKYCSK